MGVKKLVATAAAISLIAIISIVIKPERPSVAHAESLPPSILCVPNTCQTYTANSIQDVELRHPIASDYTVVPNTKSRNMKRINLEIAKLGIHYMQSVTVGVYATEVSNAGITLHINPDETTALCDVNSSVKNEGDLVGITVDNGTTARQAMQIGGTNLCKRFGSKDGAGATVHLEKSDFGFNSGAQLYEAKVTFGYNEKYYNSNDYKVLGSVGFKMQLESCQTTDAACRHYVAMIRAKTGEGDSETSNAARNFAMEGDGSNSYFRHNIAIGDSQIYYKSYFEFGLDCSFDTAQDRYIDIYDLNDKKFVSNHDSITGASLQMQVFNKNKNIWQWVTVPSSDVTPISGNIVQLGSSTALASTNPNLYGLTKDDWVFIPNNANRQVAQLKFTMRPTTRYRLLITPTGYTNFFAVGVPGDTIYGLVGCQKPDDDEETTDEPLVGDKPYFKVYGGDILAGIGLRGNDGGVEAGIISWNKDSENYFGASSQLAALASGNINHFISNGDLKQGNPSSLAFANTSAEGTHYGGKFGAMPSVPDYISRALENVGGTPKKLMNHSIDIDTLSSGIYEYKGLGGLEVHGALSPGKNITIIVRNEESVFISGDITYKPYSLTNIPQLNVYTTGNIVVGRTVSALHGMFVAQGDNSRFYTCGTAATNPIGYAELRHNPGLVAQCNTPKLTVYGSVVAHEVVLSRTSGTWVDGSAPAEEFRHGPETWLAKPSPAPSSSGNTFDNYISLPPIL